jgi:HEAT repeat protein
LPNWVTEEFDRCEYKDARAFAREGDVEGLIEALDHTDVQRSHLLRGMVIRELGNLEDSAAVPVLIEVFEDEEERGPRIFAAQALGKFSDARSLAVLRGVMYDSDRSVRLWTIQGLGVQRDRESVEALIACLADENTWIREYAARALGEIGDHRATEHLVVSTEDSNGRVRKAAASGLVALGDWNAIEPLRAAHARADWLSRRPLGRALRELEERFA